MRGSAENERRTGVDLERLEYIEDGVWDRRNGESRVWGARERWRRAIGTKENMTKKRRRRGGCVLRAAVWF